MIDTYTGICLYCKQPMSYRRPYHSQCWLAAQRSHDVHPPDAEPCYFRECTRPPTTYTKLYGYWERVCSHHADEGYSLERSHAYIAGLLDGRKP